MALIGKLLSNSCKLSTVVIKNIQNKIRCLSDEARPRNDTAVSRQSPIDIKNAVVNNFSTPLNIYFKTKARPSSKNTGHCLHIDTVGFIDGSITGGPLETSKYSLQQFHFHWGDRAGVGSEHTIKGRVSSAELHYVFKNDDYGTMREALQHADGLTVIGVLLRESEITSNDVMPELFTDIPQVKEKEVKLGESLKLESALPKDRSYFTYPGSLTTPEYNECVTWILFKNEVDLESRILKRLRSMATGVGDSTILNNWREVQDLNGRSVILANSCSVN